MNIMTENVTLIIDEKEVTAEQGKTLLDIAHEHGGDIPTICYHDATTANGLCRMCVVDVEGLTQIFCAHYRALNMPTWKTIAPGRRPTHDVIRRCFLPQREIHFVSLVVLAVQFSPAFH
jgi:hypothetical protein